MKISKLITCDPGLSGGLAFWDVIPGKPLSLSSCRAVDTQTGPHLWPDAATAKEEAKMLLELFGKPLKPTASKKVLTVRLKAYRPAKPKARINPFKVIPEGYDIRGAVMICERPAEGQAGMTTAKTIASTAASEALLTAQALYMGIPVISITPAQWQTSMLEPSVEKGDTKIRALNSLNKLRPELTERIPMAGTMPHDGVVDAILLGLWAENQIGVIESKLNPDSDRFRYPFPQSSIPKLLKK